MSTRRLHISWFYKTVLVTACLVLPSVAMAQLVNPTAPPPAGQTAQPLTSSSATQQKTGTLVIGALGAAGTNCSPTDTSGCAALCLNATGPTDSSGACIKSWSDIANAVGNSYLQLTSAAFPSTSLPASQTGVVSMKGTDGQARPYTINLTADTVGGSTGLYADGRRIDQYAGYFIGKVSIAADLNGTRGRICLNSKDNYGVVPTEDAKGYYCITTWSDIRGAPITDKLTLAAAANPATETGNVVLSRAYGAGSVVIGDPVNLSVALKCGDGMCSAGTTPALSENATNCPIDCATVPQPANFTTTGQTEKVSVVYQSANDTTSSLVRVLIVRSDQSDFIFKPVDGVVYPLGGNSRFAIIYSNTFSRLSTLSIVDAANTYGMVSGRTYYYRAYQANLYPRYASEVTGIATPTVSGAPIGSGDNGGGESSGENPVKPIRGAG